MTVERVAVIGAGTMGSGIAQVFLQHGFETILLDADEDALEAAEEDIREGFGKLIGKGKLPPHRSEELLNSLVTTTEYADLSDVDIIIEAVPEDQAVKGAVYEQASEHAEEAIYVTNTSSIPITELADHVPDPARFMGMHFFNPVPVMPLVEAIPGEQTSEETVEAVRSVAEQLDKHVVVVEDSPGFVSNRILMPFINEAVKAFDERVAAADDIDTVAKEGFNHPMGPLELADFIGLDVVVDIMDRINEHTGADRFEPADLLREKVEDGNLGRKSGEGFHTYD